MCIAVPGELISRQGSLGKVNIKGNILPVELGLVQPEIGDMLLIHAGCAIAILQQSEAQELESLLALVDDHGN